MAAALLAAAVPAAAEGQREREEYESRIDTTFAFSRNGSVELQAFNGDIIVSGWNRDQVRIQATSDRSSLRLDASQSFVSLGLRSGRSGDTRFEVTVPAGVSVRANTTSGDIRITGSRGEVEARTQHGDIVVEEAARTTIHAFSGDVEAASVSGDLTINAMNGDIRARGVTGRVEIKTVSGEIAVRDARSRDVRLNSTSGDITFDGTVDAAGRYALQTHSGDVDLALPANASAQITVSTFNGELESDFPLVLQPRPHGDAGSHGRSLFFNLGRGGARITAESFSGDITIRNRGGPSGGRDDRIGGDR